MDGMPFFESDGAEVVNRLADHVHYTAEGAGAHRHRNRPALIDSFHAADHAVGGGHGDAAHAAFAQVLLHFHNDADLVGHSKAVADNAKGLVNRGHCALDELYVHRGAGDLNYVSDIV